METPSLVHPEPPFPPPPLVVQVVESLEEGEGEVRGWEGEGGVDVWEGEGEVCGWEGVGGGRVGEEEGEVDVCFPLWELAQGAPV